MTTLSVTSEFRHEFEAERTQWLRRRFLWYSGIVGALSSINVIGAIAALIWFVPRGGVGIAVLALAANLVTTLIFVGPFFWVKRRTTVLDREGLLRVVIAMIIAAGLVKLVEIPISSALGQQILAEQRSAQAASETLAPETTSGAVEDADAVAPVGEAATVAQIVQEAVDNADADDGLTVRVGPSGWNTDADIVANPVGVIASWGASLLVIHILASLFIPWTARESYRPIWPLVICGALIILIYGVLIRGAGWLPAGVTIFLLPAVGLPGAAIAAWRHGRFRNKFSYRMMRGAYGDMKRELVDARRIHEALFPKPITTGPVRMAYAYEPMRQIGGDYIFARSVQIPGREAPVFDAVLIDVTGHGISAALTVNRLHGEIQRELGEKPGLSPGELLTGLNAYLHHTLASHSVYATAICLRIDPEANTIEWASAGHPPAFLCTADGKLERLDSTAFILGVTGASDYDADEQRTRFMPGDAIVLYTDGAIEARDRGGRHLRVDGLQRVLASAVAGGDRMGAILEAVGRHRVGPSEDDTLIVEIARPV